MKLINPPISRRWLFIHLAIVVPVSILFIHSFIRSTSFCWVIVDRMFVLTSGGGSLHSGVLSFSMGSQFVVTEIGTPREPTPFAMHLEDVADSITYHSMQGHILHIGYIYLIAAYFILAAIFHYSRHRYSLTPDPPDSKFISK